MSLSGCLIRDVVFFAQMAIEDDHRDGTKQGEKTNARADP